MTGINATAAYIYHFTTHAIDTLRYNFSRSSTQATPYFANKVNVSQQVGISGNNQEPLNWGPTALSFSSGISGLNDGQAVFEPESDQRREQQPDLGPRHSQPDRGRRFPPPAIQSALAAERPRRVRVQRRPHQPVRQRCRYPGHRFRFRRFPARISGHVLAHQRSIGPVFPHLLVRCVRHRRLAHQSQADHQRRPALGLRRSRDRTLWPARQPGCRRLLFGGNSHLRSVNRRMPLGNRSPQRRRTTASRCFIPTSTPSPRASPLRCVPGPSTRP